MRRTRNTRQPAFTLIELLIVIGIIAILVGIAITVGAKVLSSGKERLTLDALKVLDQSLAEYVASKGGNPPATVDDPRPGNTGATIYIQPVADATNMADGVTINSVGLYVAQCRGLASVDAIFKGLDAKIFRLYDPDGTSAGWDNQPELLTVFDGWGNPIRYVHPAFQGLIYGPWPTLSTPTASVPTSAVLGAPPANRAYGIVDIRRNNQAGGDADGGRGPGGRPYFYSAGPDGDPSTIADNVYLNQPQIQKN